MLFIDFSSAFKTIVLSRLAGKLIELGLPVRLFPVHPSLLTQDPPLGCVLSPILYFLHTHDCVARSSSNTILKFADDTVVVGLISGNDEKTYCT